MAARKRPHSDQKSLSLDRAARPPFPAIVGVDASHTRLKLSVAEALRNPDVLRPPICERTVKSNRRGYTTRAPKDGNAAAVEARSESRGSLEAARIAVVTPTAYSVRLKMPPS